MQVDRSFYFGVETVLAYAWHAASAINPWSPSSVMPIIR
jgi:hypothetical protein